MTRLKRKKELPSKHSEDIRFGTPHEVAEHRAQRLAQLSPDTIIEVGAGAGFQTSAFAKVAKHVIAIDSDAERLGRAKMPDNVTAIIGDALSPAVLEQAKTLAKGKIAVFLDPERPPQSAHRTMEEIKPDIREFIRHYGRISPDIAIELPPFLVEIPFDCEREYLSIEHKLNRLTVYLGALRRCERSVVQLPSGERIEQGTPHEQRRLEGPARYLLEPDAALLHAGLVYDALDIPSAPLVLGKKQFFLARDRPEQFFKSYRLLAVGEQQAKSQLHKAGTIILHGSMSEEEQRKLLGDLRRHCKGKERLHLFVGESWYLCRLESKA